MFPYGECLSYNRRGFHTVVGGNLQPVDLTSSWLCVNKTDKMNGGNCSNFKRFMNLKNTSAHFHDNTAFENKMNWKLKWLFWVTKRGYVCGCGGKQNKTLAQRGGGGGGGQRKKKRRLFGFATNKNTFKTPLFEAHPSLPPPPRGLRNGVEGFPFLTTY